VAKDWRYGDVLKRSDPEGIKHWPHHRLMFVAGSRRPSFRAVALVHTSMDKVNAVATTWDTSKWGLTDD
jgi:hypothetical protein